MQKRYQIAVGVIVLLAMFSIGIYAFMDRSASSVIEPSQDDAMEQSDTEMMTETDEAMMSDSSYLPFSPSVLLDTADAKRVLFFYADWCPTCRPVNEELETNQDKIPDDVRIIRVNYNDSETDQVEKDLAKKYGITYQHTFVLIDSEGNEVKKWNGGSLRDIITNIEER